MGLDSLKRPWLENREVPEEGSICVEVINTFHDPIFVPLVRAKQVVTSAKHSLIFFPRWTLNLILMRTMESILKLTEENVLLSLPLKSMNMMFPLNQIVQLN